MRKVLWIARREYLSTVRTKGFIIGLVVAPLLMGGGLIAMLLMRNQVDTRDQRVAIVDRSGQIGAALVEAADARNAKEVADPKTGKKLKPAYVLEVVPGPNADVDQQRLELSDRVRRGELHGFLEIGPQIVHPGTNTDAGRVRYYSKSSPLDDLRRWLGSPLNDRLRQCRMAEAGIDVRQVPDLFTWASVEGMDLVTREKETGAVREAQRSNEAAAIGIPAALTGLMFLLLMVGTSPLLHLAMEEKSQRIAEVMLGAAKPFELMLGKVIGGVAVSLTGSVFYVGGGSAALIGMAQTQLVPWGLLPWFFAYLLGAAVMFGGLFAGLGAACSDAKDAQTLQLPAMLPVLIPMFVLGPVLKEPNSLVATWMSLMPPFAPTLMLLRQALPGGVPLWQPVVALVGVLLCAVLSVWAGGRIFRVGILLQGKLPRFGELLRWVVRG